MSAKRLTARCLVALISGTVLAQPLVAQQRPYDAVQDVLKAMAERRKAADIYVERIRNNEIPGLSLANPEDPDGPRKCYSNCVVYKVEDVQAPDGTTTRQARALSPLEVLMLTDQSPNADFLELYGAGLLDTGLFLGGQGQIGDDPLVHALSELLVLGGGPGLDPLDLLVGWGTFMKAAGANVREAERSLAGSELAQAAAERVQQVAATVEEVGEETTSEGRTGLRLSAADLNLEMPMLNNQPVYMTAASIVIDPSEYVILGHRIEGTMVTEGESRPFFIEVENSDFRNVEGCDLYEPYRRTTRMGGILNDEQMAEMEEARAQLADFEAQMAGMPPAQRQMMESMIGPQMQTIRTMANGGAFEYTQEIEEILCNPDLAALFGVPGATSVGEFVDPVELLMRIQTDLTTLGYQPGNTNGIMDTLTEIAISQYQAERGLEVTGQPTGALAAVLAREAGGQG